eukprot:TRINITY_DN1843_c0_g1_i1.p1 TRINITY_DN1843_c0_g1~~TRINITY_DN1843_c0_g1_i1.p1  ORF type:complete len:149 (+),score=29.95 TRINITY_DN1843_c0_g1_i1:46-447(+)
MDSSKKGVLRPSARAWFFGGSIFYGGVFGLLYSNYINYYKLSSYRSAVQSAEEDIAKQKTLAAAKELSQLREQVTSLESTIASLRGIYPAGASDEDTFTGKIYDEENLKHFDKPEFGSQEGILWLVNNISDII